MNKKLIAPFSKEANDHYLSDFRLMNHYLWHINNYWWLLFGRNDSPITKFKKQKNLNTPCCYDLVDLVFDHTMKIDKIWLFSWIILLPLETSQHNVLHNRMYLQQKYIYIRTSKSTEIELVQIGLRTSSVFVK